jgi:hypothetical protein
MLYAFASGVGLPKFECMRGFIDAQLDCSLALL